MSYEADESVVGVERSSVERPESWTDSAPSDRTAGVEAHDLPDSTPSSYLLAAMAVSGDVESARPPCELGTGAASVK